jgi:hypothetical protein
LSPNHAGEALFVSLLVAGATASCGGDNFSADGNGSTGGSGAVGIGGTGNVGTGGTSSGGLTGVGGTGGVNPDCPDEDGDGVTSCDLDCDDSDPNNFPGNYEICGDLLDNTCDMTADEGCQGLGTFVSANLGVDPDDTSPGNPGTREAPVATIGQGIANAVLIRAATGNPVTVYVAEGHYLEQVGLIEGISLSGGYQCNSGSCNWQHDPSRYDSAILARDHLGVVADSFITRATRVDGFRLMGQDGVGMAPGRAAITLQGGSPTLKGNRIFAPTVTSGDYTSGNSRGIAITGNMVDPEGALIEANEINIGNIYGQAPIASHAIVFETPGTPNATVRRNILRGGQGRYSAGIAAWSSGATTRIEGNTISAAVGEYDSWGIVVASQAVIDGNFINTDAAGAGCPPTNWCGGIRSESGTATIVNNVILGLPAVAKSAGVFLGELERPAGTIILNSNYIDGAGQFGTATLSAAVVVYIGPCTTCGFTGLVGKIRNNILVGGAAASRFGVYEDPSAGTSQHPVALENNLFYVDSSGGGSATLYRFINGSTVTPFTSIDTMTATLRTQVPSSTIGNNIQGFPNLDETYHLLEGSPAIDKATATEAPPNDFDGEERPYGFAGDIGPDETR